MRASALAAEMRVSARGVLPAAVLAALLAAAAVAVFAVQLPLGRWQTDEYTMLAHLRQGGLDSLATRLAYSPRPFSEALLHGYGALVLLTGHPLIRLFLLTLWLGTAGAVVLAAAATLERGPARLPAALALGLAPLGFALATGPATELFFWPMAAAAYLPTVGAATALVFLLADLTTPARRRAAALALIVAAGSSEVGAALVLGFATLEAAMLLRRRDRRPHLAWWAVPGLAALLVMHEILRHRAGMVELGADRSALTGHPLAAVLAALRIVPDDLALGGTAGRAGGLLMAAALALLWRAAAPRARLRPEHAALAGALLGANLFSVAAAIFHFGANCCERHEATRLWLGDVLAFLLVLALLPRRVPGAPALATAAFAAALVLPLALARTGLRADLAALPLARDGEWRTWRSGEASGPAMAFFLPPDGGDMLVRGTHQPLRRFAVGPDSPDMLQAMALFFRKRVITVCEPYQTSNPWIIHGRHIAACPTQIGPLIVVP